MTRVLGVHHLAIVVRDLKKAEEFYAGVLNLSTIPRPNFSFPGQWYQCGEAQLHLMEMEEEIAPSDRHFALEVADFTETLEVLRNCGALLEGPGTREDGSQYLFCVDPDGNHIEITHHPPS